MATLVASPGMAQRRHGYSLHRLLVTLAIAAAAGLILFLAIKGSDYYRASFADRPLSPLHAELRSSGTIGLRLGMLGLGMFAIIFMLPLRKRWKWLANLGNTRHWLDFHVILGISAPIVITFHSAFRWRGLAGLAYWIMIVVSISGFVGRYVYGKIPRSLKSVRLSMADLETQMEALAAALQHQALFRPEELERLLDIPTPGEIRSMSILRMLWTMIRLDLSAPFRISRLRRRALRGPQWITTVGGFLEGGSGAVESILGNVRRQSGLRTKMAFLDRTEKVFHLWHVVHRPFSISFAALVLIHVGVVWSLGYY
jgi:hypothetical protein